MSISYAFSNEEYISYPELTKFVQDLNIKTKPDYVKFFLENGKELGLPPLNQIPRIYSENWRSWHEFFGLSEKKYNKHIQDLSNSDQPSKQNFSTIDEIIEQTTAQLDEEGTTQPKLQKPSESIKTPTKENPNYQIKRRKNFLTYEELKKLIRSQGDIRTGKTYHEWRKQNQGIAPANPSKFYLQWKGWKEFLGDQFRHLSYKRLMEEVRKRDIQTAMQYKYNYKDIKGAPSNPERFYPEWISWRDFHGTQISRPTYKELKEGVQRLNFQSMEEYQERRKEIHPGAPSRPDTIYPEWEGSKIFFNIQISRPTYKELKEGVQRLNFQSVTEYRRRRKEIHKGAPYNPNQFYPDEWEGWNIFLNKSKCEQVFNQ